MNLDGVKTIAVVGLSDSPDKASFRVAKYMQSHGFRIIPVNPAVNSVLNEKAYPDLSAIPGDIKIDLVNIFRRPEAVLPVVDEAISRGDAKIVWMQQGIINEEAAKRAQQSGLTVVMDKCLMVEHQTMV